MNRIEEKVRAARRRLMLARFARVLCLSLFVALLVATVAIAVPAIWVVEVDYDRWIAVWLAASFAAALLVAAADMFWSAPPLPSVAAEVDRRFGLRERLSTALSLRPGGDESVFSEALLTDADRRAERLAIADRFALRPGRIGWLPVSLVPVLAAVLLLAEPARRSDAGNTATVDPAEVKQVQAAAAELKKRLIRQRRKAEAEGLEEARELFEKIEADLDRVASRKDLDRKEALVALNDLKEQLEKRRQQLGSPDQVRRAMAQMKGLEAGPAEKVADSIKKGDFNSARDMVKKLSDELRSGKLSEEQKRELQRQIEQMQKQLTEAQQRHEEQKRELQRQIEQARREGRGQDAAKLQQKLNELQAQDAQMQQLQQMAESMSQAAQSLQQGDASQAAEALDQLGEQLGQMQQEMSELEDLQSALDDLSQSKQQMNCRSCNGAGCRQCQGNGMGMQPGGSGMGRGSGSGDRPESETDTNTYETQVRGQVRQGRAIIAGFADGPNRKGLTQEDVKSAIDAALAEESDPLENQMLPRDEREHTQQYFDRLREGTGPSN